jgi:S1-C subfamily serine protease
VERSEWPDDDAAGDASGDGSYPPAPLPEHERTWRHPSEIGNATWAHTEPPITIGRGLLLTTGAIGGLLSLAVLWAMLPSAGRGGDAAPTAVTSSAKGLPSANITVRPETLVATTIAVDRTSTTFRTESTSTPASEEITNTTFAVPATTEGTQTSQLETAPVAVGIGDSLIVTTSRAVEGRTSITLTDANGQPHDATVLMVDRDLGLALLSADAAAMTTSYGIGPAASPGDAVTVVGASPSSATVSIDADGHLTLDSWSDSTPEGTAVINSDGQLVGICSHGSSGPVLISVANVGAMLPTAKPGKIAPWMGLHITANDQGALAIDRVADDGPSSVAGIVVGDVITAVDGVAVSSVDQVKAAIMAHAPDDIVTLTITHADQTSEDIAVTVGTAPSM